MTNAEKIHFLISKRKRREIYKNWEITKEVLLYDLKNPFQNKIGKYDHRIITQVLYSFIYIGKEEIIPILIDELNENGNLNMANAYLKCGNEDLSFAAETWARENGYQVIHYGGKKGPVRWGEH